MFAATCYLYTLTGPVDQKKSERLKTENMPEETKNKKRKIEKYSAITSGLNRVSDSSGRQHPAAVADTAALQLDAPFLQCISLCTCLPTNCSGSQMWRFFVNQWNPYIRISAQPSRPIYGWGGGSYMLCGCKQLQQQQQQKLIMSASF